MSDDQGRTVAGKTLAYGSIDEYITPQLEPGKAYLIVIKGRSVGRMVQLGTVPVVVGRSTEVDMPIDDEAVSRQHAQIEPGSGGYQIADLESTNGLFVNSARVKRQSLQDGDRIQIGTSTIIKFCYQDAVEESFQRRLYESATRDALVGTYNRQYLLDNLEAEFSYCFRNNIPLSLLMLDIDYFKEVNDRYGHLTGDIALKEVAAVIQKDLRAEDVLARYGGEEFAVLLRHAAADRALAAAERIRQNVAAHVLEDEGHRFSVTLSIGFATLVGANFQGPFDLVRAADEYLYKAKQWGRNRTVYTGTPPPPVAQQKTAKPAGAVPHRKAATPRSRRRPAKGRAAAKPPRKKPARRGKG